MQLTAEWNMDEAITVRYDEGMKNARKMIVKNASVEGFSIDLISTITDFDEKAIKEIQNQLIFSQENNQFWQSTLRSYENQWNDALAAYKKGKRKEDYEKTIKEAKQYNERYDLIYKYSNKSPSIAESLIFEWNWDDIYQASSESGFINGLKNTICNALAEGFPIETVHRITGLDLETIENIQSGGQ